jgi:hypothetical protein
VLKNVFQWYRLVRRSEEKWPPLKQKLILVFLTTSTTMGNKCLMLQALPLM